MVLMNIIPTKIPDVLIIEPRVFEDQRGFFFESYNEKAFCEKTGVDAHFVQDNHSRSTQNVLRGLHYQIQQPQGKLVRVVAGAVFDVVVDLRKSSPTFGQWVGSLLIWNDPDLAIAWPLEETPIVSAKDQAGTPFKEAEVFP